MWTSRFSVDSPGQVHLQIDRAVIADEALSR